MTTLSVRHTMHRVLFVLLFAATLNASAAKSGATDAAFAALFSMPSGKPDSGKWNFPPAEGFVPGPEANLIAYLARQKKAGAHFNAYRHQGTLLHHAIRAKLPKTAAWLLENGAQPKLKVLDSGLDALSLSMHMQQAPITQLLKQKYRMVLVPPRVPPAEPVAGPSQPDEGARLARILAAAAADPAALSVALAATPQASLDNNAAAIIWQMGFVAATTIDAKSGAILYTLPVESWRILWRRLRKPVDYGEFSGLGADIQPELWAELVASGYSPKAQDALACMLTTVSPARLKALWPQMIANFPDLRQAAPRMVLGAYGMGVRSACGEVKDEEAAAKLAFLSSVGIRATMAGISDQSMTYASPALRAAAQPFVRPERPVVPRLVSVQPSCTFAMTDLWYDALKNKKEWPVDTVQLLEVPGEAQCAVLVIGDDGQYFPRSGLIDAFTGPEQDPVPSCPDPTDAYEVWRQVGGKIVKTETSLGHDNTFGRITLIRDELTGKRYYLNDGVQAGRCQGGSRMPFAYEWRGGRLVQSYPSEIQHTLYEQCDGADSVITCPGIASMSPGYDAFPENPTLFQGVSMQSLLRAKDKPKPPAVDSEALQANYVAAVLALDRATLKEMHSKGVTAGTTAKAIKAVSQSDLALEEKRKRIAPLFYDHSRLADAFDAEWPLLLLDWLPYEDWRPVMKAISLFGPSGFSRADDLRGNAKEKGMEELACDIDHARGWNCGETIERGDY
jgi:hypothetical protein